METVPLGDATNDLDELSLSGVMNGTAASDDGGFNKLSLDVVLSM